MKTEQQQLRLFPVPKRYKMAEAAKILKMSLNTLYKATAAHEIAYVKLGGRNYFLPEMLQDYIDKHTKDAA